MSERWYFTYLAVVPESARLPHYLSRRLNRRRRRRYQAVSDLRMALTAHLERRKAHMTVEESLAWVKLAFDLTLLPDTLATDPDGEQWGIERRRTSAGW